MALLEKGAVSAPMEFAIGEMIALSSPEPRNFSPKFEGKFPTSQLTILKTRSSRDG